MGGPPARQRQQQQQVESSAGLLAGSHPGTRRTSGSGAMTRIWGLEATEGGGGEEEEEDEGAIDELRMVAVRVHGGGGKGKGTRKEWQLWGRRKRRVVERGAALEVGAATDGNTLQQTADTTRSEQHQPVDDAMAGNEADRGAMRELEAALPSCPRASAATAAAASLTARAGETSAGEKRAGATGAGAHSLSLNGGSEGDAPAAEHLSGAACDGDGERRSTTTGRVDEAGGNNEDVPRGRGMFKAWSEVDGMRGGRAEWVPVCRLCKRECW